MDKLVFIAVRKATRVQVCSLRIGLCVAIALMIPDCAEFFSPRPIDEVPFKMRAENQTQSKLTVTAALPTRREPRDIYGVDLALKGMQPVWIEVKNDEAVPYCFLPSGLDPNYFSASEAACSFLPTSTKKSRLMEEHFEKLQIRNPIQPGTTVSGFLIVHRDEGF